MTDQAELHGLLAKVRDLGATLISVTPLPRGRLQRGPVGNSPSAGADAANITRPRRKTHAHHHICPVPTTATDLSLTRLHRCAAATC